MGKRVYTDSENKIIGKLYKQYLRYLKGVISEEIFVSKLDDIGFYTLSDVKFSSVKSILSACSRYVNYYIEEVLKEDKDNVKELRKEKDELNKLDKEVDTLTKIYCIYVSYMNEDISYEEYTRIVEGFDLYKLSQTYYTNINTKINAFVGYALKYAVNYLKLSEREFKSIGKRKIKIELTDEASLPIMEKIYNHYLDYLNLLITEFELYDRSLIDGIFLITEKNELDEKDFKKLISEVVNYYFKNVLGKTNKELLELKNNSLLNINKSSVKSLAKYNHEARSIMRVMFELIRDYYDLKIDYDTYVEVISDTDINKVTLTKLKYKLDRRVELFKYYAKFYAVNFLGLDEDVYLDRLYSSDIYKKSYQYYVGLCKGKVTITDFNTYETTFGIKAVDYAKEFAERNNLMDEFNVVSAFKQKDKYIRKVKNSRNYRFIMTLERNFILSDYCEMVDDYKLNLIDLRKECFDYLLVTYPKMSSDNLENKLLELRRKVDMVYDVINKERFIEDKDISYSASGLIEEFINSKSSINEFNSRMGIDLKKFFDTISFVEEDNKKLYNRFLNYMGLDNINNLFIIVFNINEVVKSIKFGINTKNGKRNFELYDYYKLLLNGYSDYEVCLKYSRLLLDEYDYNVLETFINNNKNITIQEEETAILTMRVYEDGREINNNEKISIINVMKINSVPVTRKLFNQALRRYLDGELIITKRIF